MVAGAVRADTVCCGGGEGGRAVAAMAAWKAANSASGSSRGG